MAREMHPAESDVEILDAWSLIKRPEERSLLEALFVDAGGVELVAEYGGGFSGSRLLQVRTYDESGVARLPEVVKLGPAWLTQREYFAYDRYIRQRLSGVPAVVGAPVTSADGRWAALRYGQVGDGHFEVEPLGDYLGRAAIEDGLHLLEQRLFVQLGVLWRPRRLHGRPPERFEGSLAELGYDALLPVNTVLDVERGSAQSEILDSSTRVLRADGLLALLRAGQPPRFELSERLRLEGFVVAEAPSEDGRLTLDLPEAMEAELPGLFRMRLRGVSDSAGYSVGQPIQAGLVGRVRIDRERLFAKMLGELFRPIETMTYALSWLGDLETRLWKRRRLPLGTIHGDLNLSNVLVDPVARTAQLIDFAQSREGCGLLDLQRLEAGVWTRLVLPKMVELGMEGRIGMAEALMHRLVLEPESGPPAPGLREPYLILTAIRNRVRMLLSEGIGHWADFHAGLGMCLLGTMKFRELPSASRRLVYEAGVAALRLEDAGIEAHAMSLEHAVPLMLRRDPLLERYRRGRIEAWSEPRYQLDERFVSLTLLVDQGEQAQKDRWHARDERYRDMRTLLAATEDPALVLLGPPGAGKSTVLRRLELDLAMAGLRGESGLTTADVGAHSAREPEGGWLTLFVELSQFLPGTQGQPPDPGDWLAERWAARAPDLGSLDEQLAAGRMLILVDAINEMPQRSRSTSADPLAAWRRWLQRLVDERSGNRVVFGCRSLDYGQGLSSRNLRVPQVRIEPLTDEQVRDFLDRYSPARASDIWAALEGTRQLDVVRSPYFLGLLTEQTEATGELPLGRSAMFSGFVRQALRREVERGGEPFEHEGLLDLRDRRQLGSWRWRGSNDLPDRGRLVPGLAELAGMMQRGRDDGGSTQVRIDVRTAMDWLNGRNGEDLGEAIVAAGEAIAVLDEDQAAMELMYVHQLLQEYFAARDLARAPDAELVRMEWRATRVNPTVSMMIDALNPADPLPALPQSGWEETTLLAAVMAKDPPAFLRGLMPTNLALAGRAAAQPELLQLLAADFLDELRWSLVARSRDPDADLRDRIACGLCLGDLGDPRFERRTGPHGPYLLPPLVEIPGGLYPIGDDEPIEWLVPGSGGMATDHIPRHEVLVSRFRIGRFPVTNAEWRCFMRAGGYDDDRWWDSVCGRDWRRGQLVEEVEKQHSRRWRGRFLAEAGLFERLVEEGRFVNASTVDRWRSWLVLDEVEFEMAINQHYRPRRATEPAFWRDSRFNADTQPVVGISWYEARAFSAWLGAQAGIEFRLPSEVEWEAATRGMSARRYAYGDDFTSLFSNTIETHIRRTTPIGVFPEGDTPDRISDLTGNVFEWTSSAFGRNPDATEYPYPYDATDGREVVDTPSDLQRVSRGGAWNGMKVDALAASRGDAPPTSRRSHDGLRIVAAARD